jgi:acetyltransferase
MACGQGGIYTEVFRDVSREIVPVDGPTARSMIESLRIWPLLKGTRGEPGIDLDALVEIIERLSFFASENPDVAELDINPLMASAAGCRTVDARILWG